MSSATPSTTTNAETPHQPEEAPPKIKNFEPKQPVQLDPPKDDQISLEELATWDGSDPAKPTAVAIKGTIYDVSGNKSYMEGGPYRSMSSYVFFFSFFPFYLPWLFSQCLGRSVCDIWLFDFGRVVFRFRSPRFQGIC